MLPLLFLLLRLFAVSDYDWHTAFAVVNTLNPKDGIAIFVGTVMADSVVAGVVPAVLLPLSAAQLVRARESHGPQGTWLVVALLVAAAVAYTITNHAWWLPVSAVVITVVLGVLGGLVGWAGRSASWCRGSGWSRW
ncbi:hypothetical protein [Kibdelosporangium phytohabitans]|uniref:Uncharacterized protein n=1 Tax=Kibdelosporangium phytohabitans TaxID=860235 RepID=A0A0N9HNG7_9PSEU|nr:hypothetical protein [Kibdelosporangium phytohabitans]ALG05736.1 hypothetical protein AOZ06_01295 [Kibdelosporangium phytohabitans]MBE1466268.1 Na+-translocating ferredoxin:NAD+ oxidoreductase RnfD subunit [Kibdelosporangium phytohabitans]